jgi:hypothetical protein
LWKSGVVVNQAVTKMQHFLTEKIATFLLKNLPISTIGYNFAV